MVIGVGLGAKPEPLFPTATKEITIATTAIAAAPKPPNKTQLGIPPLRPPPDPDAAGCLGGAGGCGGLGGGAAAGSGLAGSLLGGGDTSVLGP